MNDKLDRRHIVPLLAPHFPDMELSSSDEIHHFLNAVTGLEIAPEADNATAFDAWRQALAAAGYEGVWSTTPLQAAQIKARIALRVAAAQVWRDEQAARTSAEVDRLGKIGMTPLPVVAVVDP